VDPVDEDRREGITIAVEGPSNNQVATGKRIRGAT